jgi:glycosyltransferase involved in cell wall biosynthesis
MPNEHAEDNLRDSNPPRVSVIACTCGTRVSIKACLESLLSQDYPNFEILLVLSGSSDKEFLAEMARYPVRLLNEPRPGVCIARNRAIPEAQGEILCFVDDDVVVHPGWIQEIVNGFEDPQVACVIGRVVPSGPSYNPSEDQQGYFGDRSLSSWKLKPDDDWYPKAMNGDIVGFGCNMAFRKSFLENCTSFPDDLGPGAIIGATDEHYMFVQVLKHRFRLSHTPHAIVTHIFEEDLAKRKARVREIRAATVAYKLKLFVEEKEHRLATLKALGKGLMKFFRPSARKKTEPDTSELLTRTEKLIANLRGPIVFWKSRAVRNSIERKSRDDYR